MSDKITAPFTREQVDALNRFQRSGRFHPFTCGGERTDEAHVAYARQHGGDDGQLVATPEGWICPVCDYRQDWAHASMVALGMGEDLEAVVLTGLRNDLEARGILADPAAREALEQVEAERKPPRNPKLHRAFFEASETFLNRIDDQCAGRIAVVGNHPHFIVMHANDAARLLLLARQGVSKLEKTAGPKE